MTRRGKFVRPNATRYLANQERLRFEMLTAMRSMSAEMLPTRPLRVTLTFHLERINHRCDLQNLAKSVHDAGNGIIWSDDRWIDMENNTRIADAAGAGDYVEIEAGELGEM